MSSKALCCRCQAKFLTSAKFDIVSYFASRSKGIKFDDFKTFWLDIRYPQAGAELGGCQGDTYPPIFCLVHPVAPPKIFRSLSESPTQTIDSSPCCKTGPSSGPQMKMSGSAPAHKLQYGNNYNHRLKNVGL